MRMGPIAVCLLLGVAGGVARATDQEVLGRALQVKNPSATDPTKRKVVGQAKEGPSDNVVQGDPTAGGATLTVFAEGASPSTQTFVLPAAGWRPVSGGFKYRDSGVNGPIRSAQVQRTSSGRFLIKVKASGKQGAITVVPPDPGTGGCLRLDLAGGDSYHVLFGAGTLIKRNDARTFQLKNPPAEGLCPAGPGTTTTTTTTIPTTSTTTSSTLPASTTSTTAPTTTSSTTTSSTAPTTTSTTSTTTTTTVPPIQCCVPGSPMGAFACVVETASQCATAGGTSFGPGTCAPSPCPTTSTTTTTTSTSTSTSTTSTTLCPNQTFNFTMTSSSGGLLSDAQWPGGLTQQCATPGCCVTLQRPSGDVVIVGTLGDRWLISAFTGYASCSFTSGCATNGGTCSSCNGVDAPSSCPPVGIPNCTSNRPSCSAGLNGSATDTAHVQCVH